MCTGTITVTVTVSVVCMLLHNWNFQWPVDMHSVGHPKLGLDQYLHLSRAGCVSPSEDML